MTLGKLLHLSVPPVSLLISWVLTPVFSEGLQCPMLKGNQEEQDPALPLR